MLWALVPVLATSSVRVTRSPSADGRSLNTVTNARVIGDVETTQPMYVLFQDFESQLPSTACGGKEAAPVYFGKHLYSVLCTEVDQAYASFTDFGNTTTLAGSEIVLGPPERAGATRLVAVGNCTGDAKNLEDCAFPLSDGGTFSVSARSGQHFLPAEMCRRSQTLEAETGAAIFVDASDYNSYMESDTGIMLALSKTTLLLHHNGSTYSLWLSDDEANDSSRLFSMVLMLLGVVVVAPLSVELTQLAKAGKDMECIQMVAGATSALPLVLVDFSSTAVFVTVYQIYQDSGTRPTLAASWKHKPGVNTTAGLTAFVCLAAVMVAWNVLACAMAIGNQGWAASVQKTASRLKLGWMLPRTASATNPVIARACYEYAVVTALLASLPSSVGVSFYECVALGSAAMLIFVLGRDTRFVLSRTSHLPLKCLLGAGSILATVPVIVDCFHPAIVSSNAFPPLRHIHILLSASLCATVYACGWLSWLF